VSVLRDNEMYSEKIMSHIIEVKVSFCPMNFLRKQVHEFINSVFVLLVDMWILGRRSRCFNYCNPLCILLLGKWLAKGIVT
jgi:hypothetical protein